METPKNEVIGTTMVNDQSKSEEPERMEQHMSGDVSATTIPNPPLLVSSGDIGGGMHNDESPPEASSPFVLNDSPPIITNAIEKIQFMDEEEEDSSPSFAAQSGLPDLAAMPLHEWVAALTDPQTGRYPKGITTRMMDSLVKQMGVHQFPGYDRARNYNVWKTVSHFSVFLSDATRKGRIRRVAAGTYIGIFGKGNSSQVSDPSSVAQLSNFGDQPPNGIGEPFIRRGRKRKSSFPRRHLLTADAKRVCIAVEPNSPEDEPKVQDDEPKTNTERPPSRDSIDGGSGSSSNGDCPIDGADKGQPAPIPAPIPIPTLTITTPRRRGRKFKIVSTTPITGLRPTTTVSESATGETSSSRPTVITSPAKVAPRSCPHHSKTGSLQRARISDIDEFGLPMLSVEGIKKLVNNVDSVAALSNADVASLCVKLGFEDGAKALTREEVDGTALLLLSRVDITHNLGLRLGPALKLYRLVRTLQSWAKNSTHAE